jgi:hypothetical protein
MTAATKKIFERLLKVGDWVEIDPHKHRPNYLIKGTAWRVEGFNSIKQTCQITNEKTGNLHRSETLDFEEVSDSSPFKKTDIVQLKSDHRYIGRIVNCRRNKITIEWAWGGVRESLDSDKIKLFVRMVRGEQILLGDYVFKEGDRVKTTDRNLDSMTLIVRRCLPSGMVELMASNNPSLILPGCGLTIIEEDF